MSAADLKKILELEHRQRVQALEAEKNILQRQEGAFYEPVKAKAVFVSGAKVELKASSFDVVAGRYTFVSFPPERGFKTVTILKADQLAMLEITAPDQMCEALKDAPPVTALPPPQQTSGPVHFMNPIAQKIRDANATGAVNIPNPPGIPMSKITRNDEGREEIVGASLA